MANVRTDYDLVLKEIMDELEKGVLTDEQQNQVAMVGAKVVEETIRKERNFQQGYSKGVLDVASEQSEIVGVVNVGVTEYYGFFVENGTPTMTAQPFFKPGLKKAEKKAQEEMAKEIQKIIK